MTAKLGVTTASTIARVRVLVAAGLARHIPRRGVALTGEGERQAAAAFRRLKLVERLLRELLKLPADAVMEEAEAVSRDVSDRVLDSLARFFDASGRRPARVRLSRSDIDPRRVSSGRRTLSPRSSRPICG